MAEDLGDRIESVGLIFCIFVFSALAVAYPVFVLSQSETNTHDTVKGN